LKALLCMGNEAIENRIKRLDVDITDSNNDLKNVINLLDFSDADILIINRLLDDEYGYDLISIANEAKKRNIKIIILTKSYEGATEKKLISALVSREVNVFLKFSEIDDKLQNNIDNYPVEFSFNLLSSEKVVENEKIVSIERRVEVAKEVRIRELDKCTIAIVSGSSSGKTFLAWNLERSFSNSEYNTAVISFDDNYSANYLYGIDSDTHIDLNEVGRVKLEELAINLGKNRTVYTNEVSNLFNLISGEKVEELIYECRIGHEIIIIDTSTINRKNTIKVAKLSDKVIIVFDLTEYNIQKNLKLLKEIMKVYNKQNIIALINNYVECNTAKDLKNMLSALEIDEIMTINPVPGEDIYDFMGTSITPFDKNKTLKEELRAIMNQLKARDGGKKNRLKKYLRKERLVLKDAMKKYISNENTVKLLKFAVFLFIVVFIITLLKYKGITVDLIKNYFGGNE
jgi:MinD-like ATPase involved in chromosome partitioning or flagellar assembly